jgi:CheY-like chemotaxis protein
MTPSAIMATQSLLLSRDPDVLGVLRPVLEELGIGGEVCMAQDSALSMIASRKFNPVIVDCAQMEAGGELLRKLRQSIANRDSLALGIVVGETQASDAFAFGANLVLRKPLSSEETSRILRTACSLVSHMRRRFMRHVLHTLAYVHVDGILDTPMLLDVSEGGISVQALDPMEERRSFAIRFSLPDEALPFESIASPVWNDSSGRVGLRFLGMALPARQRLHGWLEAHGVSGSGDLHLAGPALAPTPDFTPDRVQFPLQLAPAAFTALTIAFDMVLVAVSVVLFGIISSLVIGDLPSANVAKHGGLLLGCVCWVLYRYVFFGALSVTPGSRIATALSDRFMIWLHSRCNPAGLQHLFE